MGGALNLTGGNIMDKILGILYVIAGIAAFLVSAIIEYLFFGSIFQDYSMAFYLTSLFECAKVLTILITRRIIIRDSKGIATPLIILGWFVKVALVVISLCASIGYLANNLDQPNLESVQEADKKRYEIIYTEKHNLLKNQKKSDYDQNILEINNRYKQRFESLSQYYEPRIEKEELARDFEFSRKINGVRKGERYREHQRKLSELSQEYKLEKDKLLSDQNQEILEYTRNVGSVYLQKLENLEKERERKLDQIAKGSYSEDSRVSNKIVNSFLSTLKSAINLEMRHLTFCFYFSVLVSFTLEGLIYLIFNNIAIFYSVSPPENDMSTETGKALREFLNKNIHNAAEFISKKTGGMEDINGSIRAND
jgi:hypothetical protein